MSIKRLAASSLAFLLVVLMPVNSSALQKLPRVMIQTELGSMEIEVDTIGEPLTAGNFLRHVDHGAYRGGRFHRTIREERQPAGRTEIEGIQGGPDPSRSKESPPMALSRKKDTGLSLGDELPSVPNNGLDAATSDFFIRAGRHPELGRLEPDGRFTVFGRVVRGGEVVRLIHTARVRDHKLTPPIGIVDVTRVR